MGVCNFSMFCCTLLNVPSSFAIILMEKRELTTVVQSFLEGYSSFLQVTSPIIKAWMSLNFGKIHSLTSELAALERLKNQ